MPIELMKDYYRNHSVSSYINMTMAIHCAPFLKGMKDSALLILKKEDAKALGVMLSKMGAKAKTMYSSEDKIILFLYREAGLKKMLRQERIARFLEGYEYKNLETLENHAQLRKMLDALGNRFRSAYATKKEFPHEIGAFLGYPIDDVIGFIENKGKNSLLTGCWKVYSNKEKAKETFRRYEQARELAIQEILDGKRFYEIAV